MSDRKKMTADTEELRMIADIAASGKLMVSESKELERIAAEELERESNGENKGYLDKPPRIKVGHTTSAGRFIMPDGTSVKKIEGAVIAKTMKRGYWLEGMKMPECFSENYKNPVKPFNPPGGGPPVNECRRCPMNAWGSSKNGRGKACRELRKSIVWETDKHLPSILSVGPTSLNNWDNFFSVARQDGWLPILNRIGFTLSTEKNASGNEYSVIQLERGDPLSLEEVRAAKGMRDAFEAILGEVVEYEDYYQESTEECTDEEMEEMLFGGKGKS